MQIFYHQSKMKLCETQTKVWQYTTLTERIYFVACPGMTMAESDETDIKPRGAVGMVENIESPQ
jgi:hypothetical protein